MSSGLLFLLAIRFFLGRFTGTNSRLKRPQESIEITDGRRRSRRSNNPVVVFIASSNSVSFCNCPVEVCKWRLCGTIHRIFTTRTKEGQIAIAIWTPSIAQRRGCSSAHCLAYLCRIFSIWPFAFVSNSRQTNTRKNPKRFSNRVSLQSNEMLTSLNDDACYLSPPTHRICKFTKEKGDASIPSFYSI